MLNEIKKVRQFESEGFRRWFTDVFFDLIVWYHDDEMTGFQLCYDKNRAERSLTWHKDVGFSHNKIDDGEVTGQNKMSPILVADGLFDNQTIADRFRESTGDVEPELADFIYNKLLEADVN